MDKDVKKRNWANDVAVENPKSFVEEIKSKYVKEVSSLGHP